jgi:hypothetical protein
MRRGFFARVGQNSFLQCQGKDLSPVASRFREADSHTLVHHLLSHLIRKPGGICRP